MRTAFSSTRSPVVLKMSAYFVNVCFKTPNVAGPSDLISIGAACDVFRRRLKRKVWHCECDVREERLVRVLLLVLYHEFDRTVRDRDSRVITLVFLDGREWLIVKRMVLGREVVVVIQ